MYILKDLDLTTLMMTLHSNLIKILKPTTVTLRPKNLMNGLKTTLSTTPLIIFLFFLEWTSNI